MNPIPTFSLLVYDCKSEGSCKMHKTISMTTSTVIPPAFRFTSLENKLYGVNTNAFLHDKNNMRDV